MPIQRKVLEMSNVVTNVSVDGNTLFLPVDDNEWVKLLVETKNDYAAMYRKKWERLEEKRLRERRLMKIKFGRKKTKEEDLRFLKLHGSLSPYEITTSKTFYTLGVLESLLRNQSVQKGRILSIISSEQEHFNQFEFQEGWWLVEEMVSMIDYAPYSNKGYMPLKKGKAIARSILADDYQYSTIRDNLEQYISEENDYWTRDYVRNV
jgi:hypothetical protein